MDYTQGYKDGFAAGIAQGMSMSSPMPVAAVAAPEPVVVSTKRKPSAYNRRYKAAFKKIAPKYKTKNGKWKAGGFKRAVKAAHKEAKK